MVSGFTTLSETQQILRPHRMSALVNALRNSVHTWNTRYAESQMVLDQSARAIIINQYWYYLVNQALSNDPGVLARRDQLQRYFVFDERIIIRFKLFDNSLHSKNYPTDRAQDWKLQLPLSGIPPCDRLEFGYRLDITGSVIKDAFLVLPEGDRILWVWQVLGSQIDTIGVQLPLTPSGEPQPNVFAYDVVG